MADAKLGLIVTPEHRAAYANLWEPVAYKNPKTGKEQGKPKYGYVGLFPDATDISALKQTALKVAKAQWGDNVDLKTVRFPFKSGDKEADRILAKALKVGKEKTEASVAFYRGNVVVKVTSDFAPKIVDQKANEIIDKSAIYSGVKVRAEFNFKAITIDAEGDEPEKRYVSVYVNFVMKTGDADRLSGKSAKDVFKGLLGGSSQADPTADDDEIPL